MQVPVLCQLATNMQVMHVSCVYAWFSLVLGYGGYGSGLLLCLVLDIPHPLLPAHHTTSHFLPGLCLAVALGNKQICRMS